MTIEFNINDVYNTLKNYGIDKKFIKEILLPEWWEDEIANSKAGYLQAISIISKNLGINIADIINNSRTINIKRPPKIKFKTAKNILIKEKDIWPQSLAVRITELINQLYSISYNNLSKTALEIHSNIIQNYRSITLENVLDYLWCSGIPVLHISEFPKDVRKMDGMTININGRPIIILSKNRKYDAWLLFIIAHELGHVIRGHLTNSDNVIYDSDIENEEDSEEKEANNFAIELLNGTSNPDYFPSLTITSPFQLVNLVRPISNKLNIDPGIIILNYAYRTKNYPLAEQSLKIINPKADALSLVKKKMKAHLTLKNLSEENYDFFIKLTSLSEE